MVAGVRPHTDLMPAVQKLTVDSPGIEEALAKALLAFGDASAARRRLGLGPAAYVEITTRPAFGRVYWDLIASEEVLPQIPKLVNKLVKEGVKGKGNSIRLVLELIGKLRPEGTETAYVGVRDQVLASAMMKILKLGGSENLLSIKGLIEAGVPLEVDADVRTEDDEPGTEVDPGGAGCGGGGAGETEPSEHVQPVHPAVVPSQDS